ncbi:MAG: STAS domain-containing protein [Chloroflexi bacterium]|jgi:anti-sigma B factor antagonist|nr:STAS domain-containing protein [Chloroflexota bacterium]
MDIQIQEYKRVAVVNIVGRIDSSSSADLEASLQALVDKGKRNLVLDMSKVEFLSSSGLRVIVNAYKACKEVGQLCVAQPSERAASSLSIAGIDTLFTVYPTREAAIASF